MNRNQYLDWASDIRRHQVIRSRFAGLPASYCRVDPVAVLASIFPEPPTEETQIRQALDRNGFKCVTRIVSDAGFLMFVTKNK